MVRVLHNLHCNMCNNNNRWLDSYITAAVYSLAPAQQNNIAKEHIHLALVYTVSLYLHMV